MAGPTPVPFEGVFVLFYFSGNGHSSVRIVHLTGEHFDIINKYKDVRVNINDRELVKMFNSTLKKRETILFFLIVVINGLVCIDSDIGFEYFV